MSEPFPSTQSNFADVVPVPVGLAAVTLLPVNPARVTFKIQSPTTCPGTLYVKLGTGASLVDYSFFLDPGDYYEPDKGEYCGEVTAILDVAGPTPIFVTDEK
jgi:hypothetical protein